METLSGMPGVVRLEPFGRDIFAELERFVFSASANGFFSVDPVGFNDVAESDLCLVMFLDDRLDSFSPEPFMELVDSRGR